MPNAREQLDTVWASARQATVARRCAADPSIPGTELRHGIGLTVIAWPDEPMRDALQKIVEELRPFDPSQYWYPPERYHVALHSVAWFRDGELPSETEFLRIANAVRNVFAGVRAPEVVFDGVTLFPGSDTQIGAIVAQGFPNPDFLLLRDRIRQTATDAGYPDRRTYAFARGEYVTCTIGRLRKQPAMKLLDKIGTLRSAPIQALRLESLSFVSHSYFFSPEHTRVRAEYQIPR